MLPLFQCVTAATRLEWYLSTVSTIDYASALFMMGRKWTWTQQTHDMLTIIRF
jgi:hypothetical protein